MRAGSEGSQWEIRRRGGCVPTASCVSCKEAREGGRKGGSLGREGEKERGAEN